jgi:hypothetical protein
MSGTNRAEVRICEVGVALSAIKFHTSVAVRSRDRAAGIAAGYGLDDREVGVRVPVRSRIFSYLLSPDRLWGPPSLLSNGYCGFFSGVKRPVHEVDHSPPVSAEVKKI